MTTEKPEGPTPEEPTEPAEAATPEEPPEPMAPTEQMEPMAPSAGDEAALEGEPLTDEELAEEEATEEEDFEGAGEEEGAEEELAAAPTAADRVERTERGGTRVPIGVRGEAGYRGSLPPRRDRLAAPWVIAVIAIFVLVLVLSALGLPSRLFTANPSAEPSVVPSASAPVASGSPGISLAPSPSP